MAQHPTKAVMHPEPVEAGNAKEEVPMLQRVAKVIEETETISRNG